MHSPSNGIRVLGIVCLVLALTVPMFSQTTSGRILGSVSDQSGAGVAGAAVVITENERVLRVAALLRSRRFIEVGPILSAAHQSLKDDFEVSCAELDLAVDIATRSE